MTLILPELWGDRQLNFTTENELDEEIQYNFTVTQQHVGAEIEFEWKPIRALSIRGMASIGNWEYKDDFLATGFNLDNNSDQVEDLNIYAKGLKVGDAAQTTVSLGASYEIIDGLKVYADYYQADNLYADFALDEDDQFLSPGGQVLELPSYTLVDAGLSYAFKLENDMGITLRFNMNNVLDEWYISELDSNGASVMESRGFVGFGRTWNGGVKFTF